MFFIYPHLTRWTRKFYGSSKRRERQARCSRTSLLLVPYVLVLLLESILRSMVRGWLASLAHIHTYVCFVQGLGYTVLRRY
ncbi:hypothetical protein BKA65DRAFT_500566 [Rhexocercosporidium sp. MPI-PUGE-AT-0058]|nr:hypothetical protein BKA65DRAFT_500566 [Rhexocercosporidium sp. MPI-PUGE-AT-0058]